MDTDPNAAAPKTQYEDFYDQMVEVSLTIFTYCDTTILYADHRQTIPSCITPGNPAKFPPIRAGEYVLERLRATAKDG